MHYIATGKYLAKLSVHIFSSRSRLFAEHKKKVGRATKKNQGVKTGKNLAKVQKSCAGHP